MIAIVDYGLGNVKSISNMLRRTGVESVISDEPDVLRSASRLILPGVGHFRAGMESLQQHGLIEVLAERVLGARVPVLGICLGAQLLGRRSDEGDVQGLQWVPMDTVRFDKAQVRGSHKVPHMGWAVTSHTGQALFAGMPAESRFYYVHSYHFRCDAPELVIATAEHGYRFPSGIAYGNIMGVQFHPEKSHVFGMQLLRNFAVMECAA